MSLTWAERVNDKVAASFVGRWFHLDGSGVKNERKGSRFFTEIRAGITTFSAMVYIIRFVIIYFLGEALTLYNR